MGDVNDDGDDYDFGFIQNASASFEELVENGEPAVPLEFDPATIGSAEVKSPAVLYDPASNYRVEVDNIVCRRGDDRAYLVGRTLRECIFGFVRRCTVLRYRADAPTPYYEVTTQRAAVKIMSKARIREIRHVEDPLKEIAAMQHVNRDGSQRHVVSVIDVLEDDEYLFLFMPLCSSGDLYSVVEATNGQGLPESEARRWFNQVLDVSERSAAART